jgi:hypothetical protein
MSVISQLNHTIFLTTKLVSQHPMAKVFKNTHVRTYTCVFYIPVTVHLNKFLFNNQPDALIIQIYFVIKRYMFRASSLPKIRSFILYFRHLVSFMQVFDERFQAVRMERSLLVCV